MAYLNKGQLIAINTLVQKLGIDKERKAAMVNGFSSGRESSSAKLHVNEAAEMIKHLKSLDPDEASAEKMRKKIIAMAHNLGWEISGTKKADMVSIDNWCIKFGYLHKKLNQYLLAELPKLVSQFEKIEGNFIDNI